MFYRIMLILVCVGVSFIAGANSCEAQQAVVTITGQKQGVLKGTPDPQQPNATSAILSFSYEVQASAGLAVGEAKAANVQHSGVVFSRRSDRASPDLYSAMITGENLTSVKFEFFATNSRDKPYYSIQLSNALVAKLNTSVGSDQRLVETVSLVFQKIEETFVESNKTAGAAASGWSVINNQPLSSMAPAQVQ